MPKTDKKQSKAFIDKARELESDDSGKSFELAVRKIVKPIESAANPRDSKGDAATKRNR